MNREEAVIETTLGDLIVALTEEATQFVRDEKEAYKAVASMLTYLLHDSGIASRRLQYWN